VKRKFRLRKSSEIMRIRRLGRSFPHPLMMLVVSKSAGGLSQGSINQQDTSFPNKSAEGCHVGVNIRAAIIAGSRLGNAVQRNRTRRRLRAAMDLFLPYLSGNHDLILLARKPVVQSTHAQIMAALSTLFSQAGLLDDSNGKWALFDCTFSGNDDRA